MYIYIYIYIYLYSYIYRRAGRYRRQAVPGARPKSESIEFAEPERYLFAVGSRAGYPVFLLFSCFS